MSTQEQEAAAAAASASAAAATTATLRRTDDDAGVGHDDDGDGDGNGNGQQLPKLTAAEFQEYNRLARHMDSFHNHFRHTWNELYATASGSAAAGHKNKTKDSSSSSSSCSSSSSSSSSPARLSAAQFLRTGLEFIESLTMHHNIEETYVFPRLAARMPAFQKNLTLVSQHKQIHAGMDKLQAYLGDCRSGARDLRMHEVKELMDSWKDVLWAHLDKEVEELGAEKMRRYWSLKEMRAFGF